MDQTSETAVAGDVAAGSAASACDVCAVRHLTLCATLKPLELDRLASVSQRIVAAPGAPLFDEGEPARHLFNVTAGTVKIYKLLIDGRRHITGFFYPGEFVGLAAQQLYVYSAEAVDEVTVCRFLRRDLEALLDRFPVLERQLLAIANRELAGAQEQMLLLGRKSATEKLATFLLNLAARVERQGGSAAYLALPMSRNDIGDHLGLTTETISRVFTQLKTRGVIALRPGVVELVDRRRLRDIAGAD